MVTLLLLDFSVMCLSFFSLLFILFLRYYNPILLTLTLTLSPPIHSLSPQVRGASSVPRYLAGTNQRDIPGTLRPIPGPAGGAGGEAVKPIQRFDTMSTTNAAAVYPAVYPS